MPPKKQDKSDELIKMMSEVVSTVKDLAGRVDKLEQPAPVLPMPISIEKPREILREILPESKFPVPKEYRDAVDLILNSSFGIKIEPMTNSPQFMFTVVVPRKYSNLTDEEFKMHKSDLRTKVISYGDGINGVKNWVDLIHKNFNPDVQAQILTDRS